MLDEIAEHHGFASNEPFVHAWDFTLPVPFKPDTVILNDANITLGSGVHILRHGKYGPKLPFLALAGGIEHPTGSVLMRTKKTDINMHGISQTESLELVRFFSTEATSWKLPQIDENTLKETCLFTTEEIARYLKGETISQDFRNKLHLVHALKVNSSPWVLLYMNVRKETDRQQLQMMADFISHSASDRIVCLGFHSSPGIPDENFDPEKLKASYHIHHRGFKKVRQ